MTRIANRRTLVEAEENPAYREIDIGSQSKKERRQECRVAFYLLLSLFMAFSIPRKRMATKIVAMIDVVAVVVITEVVAVMIKVVVGVVVVVVVAVGSVDIDTLVVAGEIKGELANAELIKCELITKKISKPIPIWSFLYGNLGIVGLVDEIEADTSFLIGCLLELV